MKRFFKRMAKNKKGASEITQSLMLAGASIALVVLSLFPSLKTFTGSATEALTTWFADKAITMFTE